MQSETSVSVNDHARLFVSCDLVFQERPLDPVHERWTTVLTLCPFTRGKFLHDEFDDELNRVYETGTFEEVFGASELVMLRWRFFAALAANKIGMTHVAEYEVMTAYVWMRRMTDRLTQMEDDRANGGKPVARPITPKWLN